MELYLIYDGKISEKLHGFRVAIHRNIESLSDEEIESISQEIKEMFVKELKNLY